MTLLSTDEFADSLRGAKFERGKPADPTKNMSPEDAKEWERQNEEHKDEFKSASSDEKDAKFEKGKPADPTKNMSPEDAKEWEEQNEEHKDEFKSAKVKLRITSGTRVVVNANPASRMLYRDLPPDGSPGEVVAIPVPGGKKTFMPGPGGGLVYVKFDDGSFMGVSPNDLDKEGAGGKLAAEDDEDESFEVQYFIRGVGWKRKKFKNQKKYNDWHDAMVAKGDEPDEVRFEDKRASSDRLAENLPPDVERYVKEVQKSNPDYSEGQAWATAWSIYCKKNPDSEHCHQSAYFKGASIEEYAEELDKDAKFEKGKSMTVEEVSKVVGPEFKEMNEDPPESVKKLQDEMEKKAEWKEWTEDMPVQVVTSEGSKIFDNLAAAKKKYPTLDPKKNTKDFTWATRGEVKGKPAIRFEDWPTYNGMRAASETDKTAASGLYGFTKEAERVCGTATSRLSKFTTKLAKDIYTKDADTPGFLEEHQKRTGSRAARMLRACMADIGPGAPGKTAGKREGGRYGFSGKTAKLALQACLDVEHEAGVIACDLNARMGSKHAAITGFLAKHAKKAKCGWSEMIQEAYPAAPAPIIASVSPKVSEILAWDRGVEKPFAARVASSFLAAEEDLEAEEESLNAKC